MQESTSWFARFSDKFVSTAPGDQNAFELCSGKWKFDFDKMTVAEISKMLSSQMRMARLCAEIFGEFRDFDVLELGPAEGYHSAIFEECGARSVLAIEGNADAFLKCLILKNALNLRTKYLLGDFTKYLFQDDVFVDLIFASGVLYHLVDPVEFLLRCGQVSNNLYIWTLYYDEKAIRANSYERKRFSQSKVEKRVIEGQTYEYHQRINTEGAFEGAKYSGGLQPVTNWLDRETLFRAIDCAGFEVVKTLDDVNPNLKSIPAINIFATKR